MSTAFRIVSWNVNSFRIRLEQIKTWLSDHPCDALLLQEIKQHHDDFDRDALAELGYQGFAYGQKSYNGVAIFTPHEISDLHTHLPNPRDGQARGIALSIGALRLVNVYVPNGQRVGAEAYHYKLEWLQELVAYLREQKAHYPNLIIGGDFNIAPADLDVYDPKRFHNKILCSPAEREQLAHLLALGFRDTFRDLHPHEQRFSWWDYRQNAFERDHGLRIDLLLSTLAPLAAGIDPAPRQGERPSDHCPVWLELARDTALPSQASTSETSS